MHVGNNGGDCHHKVEMVAEMKAAKPVIYGDLVYVKFYSVDRYRADKTTALGWIGSFCLGFFPSRNNEPNIHISLGIFRFPVVQGNLNGW